MELMACLNWKQWRFSLEYALTAAKALALRQLKIGKPRGMAIGSNPQ